VNYLNIHTDLLRSQEFLGAEPIERATWISLLGWCATQENGGVIEGCSEWSSRKWQQICGATKEEVETKSELYGFEDGNLMVFAYPKDKESEVKLKRKLGKKGGRPKKSKPDTKTQNSQKEAVSHEIANSPEPLINKDKKPYGYDQLLAIDNHQPESAKTEREGKGRERKDKGKKIEGAQKRTSVSNRAFNPPNKEEFIEYLVKEMPSINPEWTEERTRRAAKMQFDTFIENKWKDGNGSPVKNWKSKAKNILSYKKPWNFGSIQPAQRNESIVQM